MAKASTLRILFVTRESASERRYGVGRSLSPIVAELERRGHETRYLCQADLGETCRRWMDYLHRQVGALCQYLPRETAFHALIWAFVERFNMGRVAAKVAERERFTHVHCQDPIIAMGFRLFAWFGSTDGVRWGVSQHGFGCYSQAIHDDGVRLGTGVMAWMRKRERNTLMAADWVIAPTQASLTQVARDLGVHPIPANWSMVYHSRPQVTRYAKEEARCRLGWDMDAFYVLGVGRLVPLKGFAMLIRAVAGLTHDRPVRLVLVGEGDRESLRDYARVCGLDERVLSFAVTDDIGLYLGASDIYVSASASESFGIANLEAMLAGVPTICTAVGGVPEVVGSGGVLAAPQPEALAARLQQCVDDAPFREKMAREGLARGLAWPDATEIADQYEKIYLGALATKNSAF